MLIFLLLRKWTFIKGFALSAAGVALLSFLAVGAREIIRYADLLLNIARNPHNLTFGKASDMATLQGFLSGALGSKISASSLSILVAAGSIVLIVFTAWSWRRNSSQD